MSKSRNASPAVFGYYFQSNAAIILMLDHIRELKTLRLEGNCEDIEIELNNGRYILAQAKAIERASSDFTHVRENLKKALQSLSEGNKQVDAKELILITNSRNPLHERESRGIFEGLPAYRRFSTLPESSQEIIRRYLGQIAEPLDTDRFTIQTLPFETDDDKERLKYVLKAIDDFVGELKISINGITKELHSIWSTEILMNGSKRDKEIKLTKRNIIWPMLAIVTDVERLGNDEYTDQFSMEEYEEILHLYKEIIDWYCERCELFIGVLYDYSGFRTELPQKERVVAFVNEKWQDYLDKFSLVDIDPETRSALIKVILYSIIRRRTMIDRIKKGVNGI